MTRLQSTFFVCLALLLTLSCEEKKQPSKKPQKKQLNFFNISFDQKRYTTSDTFFFRVKNLDQKNNLDSVNIYAYSTLVATIKVGENHKPTKQFIFGTNNYQFKAIFSDGSTQVKTRNIDIWPTEKPKKLRYKVVNTYPHNTNTYTQGLEFNNEELIESGGQFNESSINRTNPYNGKTIQKAPLLPSLFGEGTTIFKGKIHQLTWKSQQGFIYDLNTLEQIGTFQYPDPIEGWGLTHNTEQLIVSNGSSNIFFWNPDSFRREALINVVDNERAYFKLNELEYVEGKIYANIYTSDNILELDAATGVVTGILNLEDLLSPAERASLKDPYGEVLNGIAYHPKRKTFFITGKHWPTMFEIQLF